MTDKIRMGAVTGSSLVKQVGFSAGPGEKGSLRIKLKDATIDFKDVPYGVYRRLVTARDHSQSYLRNIYGQYGYQEV